MVPRFGFGVILLLPVLFTLFPYVIASLNESDFYDSGGGLAMIAFVFFAWLPVLI